MSEESKNLEAEELNQEEATQEEATEVIQEMLGMGETKSEPEGETKEEAEEEGKEEDTEEEPEEEEPKEYLITSDLTSKYPSLAGLKGKPMEELAKSYTNLLKDYSRKSNTLSELEREVKELKTKEVPKENKPPDPIRALLILHKL